MKDTIVFAFGRCNPPTSGHAKMVRATASIAKKLGAEHAVWVSRSQDAKKNPLDVNTKVEFLKKMVPGTNIYPATPTIRTFIEVAKQYSGKYKNLVMVAGSDRISEYKELLNKYNGKDYQFDEIAVVSAGERDPDAEGVTGISGTKMREFAANNDLDSFMRGTEHLSKDQVRELMLAVRRGMKLESEYKRFSDYLLEQETLEEAEYEGRKVTLNKPFYTPDGPSKSAVYVKNKEGKVVIVRFGDPNMKIKKSDPERRKSFRARHNCDSKDDPTTPGYWSCKAW